MTIRTAEFGGRYLKGYRSYMASSQAASSQGICRICYSSFPKVTSLSCVACSFGLKDTASNVALKARRVHTKSTALRRSRVCGVKGLELEV